MTGLQTYRLPNEDEFEDMVIEPVTPIKQPELWMGPVSARNMDYLEIAIEALQKLASPVASELQLLHVQLGMMRPGNDEQAS